jgi:FdhE protein
VSEAGRPTPRPRSESREALELRSIRERHPELAEAVDMHLELLELQRRIQGRVPLPSLDLSSEIIARHQADARPLLTFEAIPVELTDLRLMVRQTADVLRRFGALDDDDYQKVQAIGRDMKLLAVVGDWYRSAAERSASAPAAVGHAISIPADGAHDALSEVIGLAMRPFLSRCAEVLQQRADLLLWTHPRCPLCGGAPDFAVITPAAERHLICGRCALRWRFEPLTCPFCRNSDKSRITSFAARLGEHDYRVYACDVCHRFLKAFDARRSSRPVMPVVDGVATLPLDAAAMQRGYTN